MPDPIPPFSVVQVWGIHDRQMRMFVQHLPPEALAATLSARGGRTIGRQLAHLHAARVNRLKAFAKRTGRALTAALDAKETPSASALAEALTNSGTLMGAYIKDCEAAGGVVPNFRRGVVAMLGYYIAHESHHRGHAVLTARQAGITLREPIRMEYWAWNALDPTTG